MHAKLLATLEQITQLDINEQNLICDLFKPIILKKGDYFVKTGEKSNRIAFLQKGLVRNFVYKDEKELTLEFTRECEFLADYQGLIHQNISSQSVQAIEDCEILSITFQDLKQIYNTTKNGNLLGRVIIEQKFNVMINQILSIYVCSPEERYRCFLNNYSHMVHRIPQYFIASYLGIKPQSLSRIRKRMACSIS